jgi:hypothetical protein
MSEITPVEGNPSQGPSGNNVAAFEALLAGTPPPEEQPIQEEPQGEEPEALEAEDSGEIEEEYQAKALEEPEPQAETFNIKVNGQEVPVTLDELKAGYSRQSDYTQKTMQIAEERKALEADRQNLQALINDYQNALQSPMPAMEPPVRPDAKLWDEDPIEAMRQTELYRQKMEDFQAESAKHQHLQQQAMAQKQQQMQEALNQQQVALKERIPEWQNEETATKEKQEIRRFGLSMGFTENELAQIYDSRAVQVLRDAMRYNQLQTKRGKVRQAPQGKSLAPGTPTPGEPQQLRKGKAMKRLAETGHIKDAQAVFEQILGT